MKKMLYKCGFLFCAVILALSLSGAAFASDISPMGAGPGYNQGTLELAGKTYSYNIYIEASTTLGARTACDTQAAVRRDHANLSVQFDTINYGYPTESGGAQSTGGTYIGTSHSRYVKYSGGMAQVIGYKVVSSSVTVYSDVTNTYAVRLW